MDTLLVEKTFSRADHSHLNSCDKKASAKILKIRKTGTRKWLQFFSGNRKLKFSFMQLLRYLTKIFDLFKICFVNSSWSYVKKNILELVLMRKITTSLQNFSVLHHNS